MGSWIEAWWPVIVSTAAVGIAVIASAHAVLNKREVRAATGWVGLIVLLPFAGALLYLVLGINRIRRTAARVRGGMQRYDAPPGLAAPELAARLPPEAAHLVEIARALDTTARWRVLAGNRLEPLRDGDEAYPAMLRAIDGATRSIGLLSYIFDADAWGRRFVDALAAAAARGVAVRVLVDDAGARYSFPSIDRLLRHRGVRVARFLPVWQPWSVAFANLRNHRKILVVDGVTAFTGGMNIREGCCVAERPRKPTRDLHFVLAGPIVGELVRLFAEDWTFATREVLAGDAWFRPLAPAGDVHARLISDGPDEDLDGLRWALLAALGSARRSVRIVTPYFLPDEALVAALNTAALRGLEVDIVLPARGNLWLVNWAMRGELWKVVERCRVWLTPAPFDHSKLMIVDGAWSLIGSGNWDPRSLRLNFELGVECYDRAFAARLEDFVAARIATAHRLTLGELAARPWPVRVRDATARLATPYL